MGTGEGRRIVERHLPRVLHVRATKYVRKGGWIHVDVSFWQRRLARAIDRAIVKIASAP